MSRAVDQDVANSLKSGDPQIVYKDIVAALNSSTSDLMEVELLGKGHLLPEGHNILQDGHSIGVPKLKLVQAFVIARRIFFEGILHMTEDKLQSLQDASAVMLLMDPENLTAANARKRIVNMYQTRVSSTELEVILNRELLFTDSLLTSPLHRHTKSPTLWNHRRWLLELGQPLGKPRDVQRDLTAVILIAAERHPRNYYAWSHFRWLINSIDAHVPTPTPELTSAVRDWCLRHPGDISGWSALLFCLSLEKDLPVGVNTRSSICDEVLGLASSFNWTHESVWVFLRTMVASGEVTEEQQIAFLQAIKTGIEAQAPGSRSRGILQASLDCLCGEQRPPGRGPELSIFSHRKGKGAGPMFHLHAFSTTLRTGSDAAGSPEASLTRPNNAVVIHDQKSRSSCLGWLRTLRPAERNEPMMAANDPTNVAHCPSDLTDTIIYARTGRHFWPPCVVQRAPWPACSSSALQFTWNSGACQPEAGRQGPGRPAICLPSSAAMGLQRLERTEGRNLDMDHDGGLGGRDWPGPRMLE
ncbi:hypothetical protein BP6252_12119 [Coleophoma cylindrospora]|uniref:Protein prenyltransferase alpha subunit repeat-containing protein 1 n=1 Tax=Coleophoma cylindrospora TaxID=1849047 RepID=A0A3D8QFV6_9HELO|nr:hypothetical protein BP6252_12119 [Coleophoma cylindrospora]